MPLISIPRATYGSTEARSSTTSATVLPCRTFAIFFDLPIACPPMVIVPVLGVDEEADRVVLHLPAGGDRGEAENGGPGAASQQAHRAGAPPGQEARPSVSQRSGLSRVIDRITSSPTPASRRRGSSASNRSA